MVFVNALIKKRFLLARLHKSRIRVSKKALLHLIGLLQKNCLELIEILERELIVRGKKTLTVATSTRLMKNSCKISCMEGLKQGKSNKRKRIKEKRIKF
jgi:hypothetical protein